MPRTIRASAGGYCYHVLNRGNARSLVLFQPADYQAFLGHLAEAGLRIPMRLLTYCPTTSTSSSGPSTMVT